VATETTDTRDTETTDEELVVHYCEHREERAFDELVHRYRESVFQLAVSILGPNFVGEAEEVAQEVILRVHYSLRSFRREAKFGSWIYRITFNQALNVKARVRYRARHISYQTLAEVSSPDGNPLDTVDDCWRDHVLSECIFHLPEVYQSVLRLYYWMDYSVAEISTFLGVPQNTVKSYLHRARHALRALLEQKGYRDA
jgi:RNA polymerase sigma-70 factor (ECF subfamily)